MILVRPDGGRSAVKSSCAERPCLGCRKAMLVLGSDPGKRICQDCREELLENLAVAFDPRYDRKAMHEAEELFVILGRMYGTMQPARLLVPGNK